MWLQWPFHCRPCFSPQQLCTVNLSDITTPPSPLRSFPSGSPSSLFSCFSPRLSSISPLLSAVMIDTVAADANVDALGRSAVRAPYPGSTPSLYIHPPEHNLQDVVRDLHLDRGETAESRSLGCCGRFCTSSLHACNVLIYAPTALIAALFFPLCFACSATGCGDGCKVFGERLMLMPAAQCRGICYPEWSEMPMKLDQQREYEMQYQINQMQDRQKTSSKEPSNTGAPQ